MKSGMRAMRVHRWGEPPVLEQCNAPREAAGCSIVRIEAATVGHLDRTIWSGGFLRPPPLPYTPGVDGAGVILRSGAFAPGTRVWLRGGGLGIACDGTWAEQVSVPDHAIGVLPDNVSFELGAAFFSPCTSAWVALREVGRVRAGERVAVTGAAGAVGAIACQLAREAGASVTGIVGDAARAARLAPGVAPLVLPRGATEAPASFAADLLIDTVGGPVLAALLPRIAPGGRAVLVGYLGGHALALDLPAFIQRDVSLLPLNMIRREAAGRAAAPALLGRLGAGELVLEVTCFALEQAAAALDWLAAPGHSGRAVLLPSPGRRDRRLAGRSASRR